MKAGKYQEAIALCQEVLQLDPQNARADELIELAERSLCQHYYKDSIQSSKIPYFLVDESSLTRYALTHQEGFVVSRINGAWDVKSIVMLSPLRELEVLQVLDKLVQLGLIALK